MFCFRKCSDIWNVYGECENISVMSGHTGSIQEIHFSTDGGSLFTCSTDKNLSIWDVQTTQRVRKLKGHTGFVNSCQGSRRGVQMLVSGSDDNAIKIWDSRKRHAVATYDNTYQVTATSFNDTTECIITGGIDNDIKVTSGVLLERLRVTNNFFLQVWDMRKNEVLYRLRGHTDTVTGISLSPDGSYVLSNSMDNTLRIWDIRPYAPAERCVKIFTGHQHNFEKNLLRCAWSPGKSTFRGQSRNILDRKTPFFQFQMDQKSPLDHPIASFTSGTQHRDGFCTNCRVTMAA